MSLRQVEPSQIASAIFFSLSGGKIAERERACQLEQEAEEKVKLGRNVEERPSISLNSVAASTGDDSLTLKGS